MPRNLFILILLVLSVSACGTVRHARLQYQQLNVDDYQIVYKPTTGDEKKVQIGETMIESYKVATLPALALATPHRHITYYRIDSPFKKNLRMSIDIPSGTLALSASDGVGGSYYVAQGGVLLAYETVGGFTDQPRKFDGGVHIAKDGSSSVYWCMVESACQSVATVDKDASIHTQPTKFEKFPGKASLRRELVYSGTSHGTLSLLYREFIGDMARPAFYQELKYDVLRGSVIGYKGARFEVLNTDNTSLTFRLVSPLNEAVFN